MTSKRCLSSTPPRYTSCKHLLTDSCPAVRLFPSFEMPTSNTFNFEFMSLNCLINSATDFLVWSSNTSNSSTTRIPSTIPIVVAALRGVISSLSIVIFSSYPTFPVKKLKNFADKPAFITFSSLNFSGFCEMKIAHSETISLNLVFVSHFTLKYSPKRTLYCLPPITVALAKELLPIPLSPYIIQCRPGTVKLPKILLTSTSLPFKNSGLEIGVDGV